MAADQAQMMAFQALMGRMQQQHQQAQGAQDGGASQASDDPAAQLRAAMTGMMQQQQDGGNSQQTPDLQQRQQMLQMFMKKAAAAAAAGGANMNQDGASGGHAHGSGGHGHSHGPGQGQCGHSHGQGPEKQLDDKSLAEHQLMMVMQQQLNFMQRQHKQTINTGYVLQHPDVSQGPRESYLYGGGHFTPPIFGWGNLAKNYVDPQEIIDVESGKKKPSENLQEKLQVMMEGKGAVPLQNVWLCTLPLLGRLRVVKDPLGLLQASFTFFYWLFGNFITWGCVLLPQYAEDNLSAVMLLVYFILSSLTIASFFRAVTSSPGTTPDSQDSRDADEWTFCEACEKKRPPKAHHCRRCGQCVPLMDHHCPWINNCVGQGNQWLFLQLLIYTLILSIITFGLNLGFKFYFPECQSCDKESFLQRHQHGLVNSCMVMAVLMLMSACGLVCTQHSNIVLGITTVEWMMIQRDIKLAGDTFDWNKLPKPVMSFTEAYTHVCGVGHVITWLFPCRKRRAPMTKPSMA